MLVHLDSVHRHVIVYILNTFISMDIIVSIIHITAKIDINDISKYPHNAVFVGRLSFFSRLINVSYKSQTCCIEFAVITVNIANDIIINIKNNTVCDVVISILSE